MNDFYLLVSIVVITYNSSHYVLETLESIKSQTYKNIELIVTDDCSSDDTIFLCQNWIEKNKSNFVRTSLLQQLVIQECQQIVIEDVGKLRENGLNALLEMTVYV